MTTATRFKAGDAVWWLEPEDGRKDSPRHPRRELVQSVTIDGSGRALYYLAPFVVLHEVELFATREDAEQ